jgi:hypothetical protein
MKSVKATPMTITTETKRKIGKMWCGGHEGDEDEESGSLMSTFEDDPPRGR